MRFVDFFSFNFRCRDYVRIEVSLYRGFRYKGCIWIVINEVRMCFLYIWYVEMFLKIGGKVG